MGNIKYGHDIAHCLGGIDGVECEKKGGCVRYLAHLEAEEMGFTYLYYIIPQRDENGELNNCFWKN